MKRQKNDATLSKLGDIYQYYIALLECFKMKQGDCIQIELQGDVTLLSDGNVVFQKEVKHHTSGTFLSDRDIDLWNTLKNWFEYYSESMHFDELILFTTADIQDTSIYRNWNNKTKEEKHETLYSVGEVIKEKEQGFRPNYNSIFNGSLTQNELYNLLDKVKIEHLQPKVESVSTKFTQYIITIPENNKDSYIAALLGLIMKQVVYPPHKWEITYDDFQKHAQIIAKSYIDPNKASLPLNFESVEPNDNETEISKDKVFVKELERIEYEKMIPKAISDYWKATKTITHYFIDNITYTSSLTSYRKSLNDSMVYAKETILNKETLAIREDQIKHSKILCSDILGREAKDFGSIIGNQSFFKNGVIHNIIDDKEFTWDVGDNDES